MPQIRVKTKDPFAVTAVCEWLDSQDVDNLDVSRPDADDIVTVTLYGMSETDPRFNQFAALVAEPGDDGHSPWMPAGPYSVPLDRITVEKVGDGWNAHFEALPTICFFGDASAAAAEKLCDDFGISVDRLQPGDSGLDEVLLVSRSPRRPNELSGLPRIREVRRIRKRGKLPAMRRRGDGLEHVALPLWRDVAVPLPTGGVRQNPVAL